MNNAGTVIWKDQAIGTVTDIVMDMWYLQANWHLNTSDIATDFNKLASNLKPEEVIQNPAKGMVIKLQYNDVSLRHDTYLVISVQGSEIFMRLISDEIANFVSSEFDNKSTFGKSNKPWWKFW